MTASEEILKIWRKEFEEYVENNLDDFDTEYPPEWLDNCGFYAYDEHNLAFRSWVAARESMAIKIPKSSGSCNCFQSEEPFINQINLINEIENQGINWEWK